MTTKCAQKIGADLGPINMVRTRSKLIAVAHRMITEIAASNNSICLHVTPSLSIVEKQNSM